MSKPKYNIGDKVACLSIVFDGGDIVEGSDMVNATVARHNTELEFDEPTYTVERNGLYWLRSESELRPVSDSELPNDPLEAYRLGKRRIVEAYKTVECWTELLEGFPEYVDSVVEAIQKARSNK